MLVNNYTVQKNETNILIYHGAVLDKESTLKKWLRSENTIIISTPSSFGMGINKLNVRFAVYLGVPRSVLEFVQCSGRTGRDNKPSDFFVMFRDSDLASMLMKMQNKKEKDDILTMYNILVTNKCIRQQVLSQFGESCQNCSNCSLCEDVETKLIDAREIVDGIRLFLSNVSYGTTSKILDCILGSKTIETDLKKGDFRKKNRAKNLRSNHSYKILHYRYNNSNSFPNEPSRSKSMKQESPRKLPTKDTVKRVLKKMIGEKYIHTEGKTYVSYEGKTNYLSFKIDRRRNFEQIFPKFEHFVCKIKEKRLTTAHISSIAQLIKQVPPRQIQMDFTNLQTPPDLYGINNPLVSSGNAEFEKLLESMNLGNDFGNDLW